MPEENALGHYLAIFKYKNNKLMLNSEKKKEIINHAKTADNDTGSPAVQVSLLTHRINYLTSHLRAHSKDFSAKRGLMKLISQRKRLLDYLNRTNASLYEQLTTSLSIRRKKA